MARQYGGQRIQGKSRAGRNGRYHHQPWAWALSSAPPVMRQAYDTAPVATIIADWRRQGMMVAKVVPYAGEYEFTGRLSEPLSVTSREDIPAFAAQHPHGRLLLTFSARRPLPPGLGKPLWTRPWRGVTLGAWDTAVIAAQQPR